MNVEIGDDGALEAEVDYSGSFNAVDMNWLGGENYEAILPAFDCDSSPEYYMVVDGDLGGQARLPVAAPAEVFSAVPVSDLQVVFDDNCETDAGWTTSGTASDGGWDLGIPVGGGDRGDAPNDAPGDSDGSTSCWQTDNVDGNSDVDNGTVTLTSPVLDASAGGMVLSYWRWFSNVAGGAPNEDVFTVEVSDDGGANWIVLEVVGPTGQEASGGWYFVEFELDQVAGLSPSNAFRVQFTAEDINAGSVVEAAVDGISLTRTECVDENDCPGDVVGDDGVVNVEDVLGILAVFGTDNPDFDIDGSGLVDVNDILIVIAAWGNC